MSRSFDDRVAIYLAIESLEWASSMLTARLGVRPDREWAVGDVRGKTGKQWECHGWVVETVARSEENGGKPASELIAVAVEKFEHRVGPFAKFASSLGGSAQKYTVLTIVAEEVPGIELSHSFLQLLTDLGGTFQVDLSTGFRLAQ